HQRSAAAGNKGARTGAQQCDGNAQRGTHGRFVVQRRKDLQGRRARKHTCTCTLDGRRLSSLVSGVLLGVHGMTEGGKVRTVTRSTPSNLALDSTAVCGETQMALYGGYIVRAREMSG